MVKGKQKKMPNDVLTAFVQLLTKYTAGSTDYLPDTPIRPITDAIVGNRSEYDGPWVHWERMDGCSVHHTTPHMNHGQAPAHGMDGILWTPLAEP